MTWQAVAFGLLALTLVVGFVWYERERPPARLVALVAALAALAVAGRLLLAPVPNVVATTDVALLSGYALGPAPGFAVGALAAPISNIWLGQGPWTAWQMAGWGLVGLGGALVAATVGRRLGRLGLATLCGLAGLAYGALLDFSVMVTYGGEQSLDRYLALSARGIPFNIAHAAGNFALALAAGPALVRMISRYRTRFEFTWRASPALGAALVAIALGATAGPGEVASGAPDSPSGPGAARQYLERSQNADGGFAISPGSTSSPAITGWTMLGLEAAGRNPLDVRNGGPSPVGYLRRQVGRLRATGDLERTILALVGAGRNPSRFAGKNLVRKLRIRRSDDGSFEGQVNLTAFGVLALRAAGTSQSELRRSADWLRAAQGDDGGWGFRSGAASDPDSTGAALQALAAAGADGAATDAGVDYLRDAQLGDGGFALAGSSRSNSQSTAWATQGLVAAGVRPGSVRSGGSSPLEYLDARQASDGHYRYSSASDQTPVWVTAQTLLAVEEKTFPLAAVPRSGRGGGRGGRRGGRDRGDRNAGAAPAPAPAPLAPSGAPAITPSPAPAATGAPTPASGGRAPDAAPAPAGGKGRPSGSPPAVDDVVDRIGSMLATPATETAPAGDDGPGTGVYVAAGFGLLVLALGAGFVWYRRRLP